MTIGRTLPRPGRFAARLAALCDAPPLFEMAAGVSGDFGFIVKPWARGFNLNRSIGLLLLNHCDQGRLVLIDFGLCARVDLPAMRCMTAALVHLMAGDVPKLLDDAVELGFLHATVDRTALLPVLDRVFAEAKIAADTYQGSDYTTQMRRKQFRAVSGELNQIFFDFPFQVPDYFALVTRALIVLEGTYSVHCACTTPAVGAMLCRACRWLPNRAPNVGLPGVVRTAGNPARMHRGPWESWLLGAGVLCLHHHHHGVYLRIKPHTPACTNNSSCAALTLIRHRGDRRPKL